jgi:hypothetical protein
MYYIKLLKSIWRREKTCTSGLTIQDTSPPRLFVVMIGVARFFVMVQALTRLFVMIAGTRAAGAEESSREKT